jgi:hypothetical protein
MPNYINNTYIIFFVDIVDVIALTIGISGFTLSTNLSTKVFLLLTLLTLTIIVNSTLLTLGKYCITNFIYINSY